MNRYTYNGEVLELTDIAEEGLVSLIGFHDLFRQYEEEIEQLLGMHEEGMMLLMLILDMKQNGKLSHNTYPTILHPVIDNLINEMFTLIDICSGINIEGTKEYKELVEELSKELATTEAFKNDLEKQ